ncbi:hypothetical protein BCU26_019325 [Vibrio splendidus]|uniref:hypothetical protein n=1 Tax=Vibrio TaxID=662 RepID=UPI000C84BC83|nr:MULTISPECIES: hypothetical protein [Vibrio]PMH67289.1 hypothetical protein BCU61_21130 [Vibrio splendidus]PMJ26993.1 hypothetical protein BCU26_20400 [Vibrio splendidus]PMN99155.1 hypothetical protein BCT21_01140 [Vibrio sp. 10N.222.55.F9]
MSVELVKEQTRRFLSTETPEVLAIKGDWGIGKTYSWEQYIEEFKGECALKSYSYVSLFGINSISELKQTTFLNTIDTKRIGQAPNIKGYSKKVADLVKDTKIPYVSRYVGGIGSLINSVSQLAMNKTIICFDDLERHSNGINIKDFMGLVSFFKEQKGCKVVLLLNEQAGDKTFEDYRKYKEKIVDRQLHFEPTAEQCFDTMFVGDFEFKDYVRDCCVGLDIKNKRVIRKIVEHTKEFLELVDGFDESIKRQVIHSTIVLSWCYYCHGADEKRIPEFGFVKQSGARKANEQAGWPKEITVRWNMTLSRYGYGYTDEIDLAVARGIEQGFLDKEKLIPLCIHKQKEFEIQNASVKWDEAWRLFHGSFNNNEKDIALAFEEGMRDIASSTSASQYSSGLKVLRTIEKDDKADELIEFFIDSRRGSPEAFDVDSAFSFEVKDERFVERLRESYLELKPEPTVKDILDLRRGSNSYNSSEAEILARLKTEDIYSLFMSFEGEELTDYIRVFMLLAGSNQDLATKVNDALDKIASISELNKYRMGKFRN